MERCNAVRSTGISHDRFPRLLPDCNRSKCPGGRTGAVERARTLRRRDYAEKALVQRCYGWVQKNGRPRCQTEQRLSRSKARGLVEGGGVRRKERVELC